MLPYNNEDVDTDHWKTNPVLLFALIF